MTGIQLLLLGCKGLRVVVVRLVSAASVVGPYPSTDNADDLSEPLRVHGVSDDLPALTRIRPSVARRGEVYR